MTSRESGRDDYLLGRRSWVGFLVAVAITLAVPTAALAASPVLEYEFPAGHPVTFTTDGGEVIAAMAGFEFVVHCTASHGEGEITGPRSTISKYSFTGCATQKGQKCKTEGAQEEEITAGPMEAELVWISQAKHEVGELLNPHGGTYIAFECGGETAEGVGAFLARVTPINSETASFAAALSESASIQTPSEYEAANGEMLQAIPMGRHGSHELVTTGVESTFLVHPSVAVEIKAVTAQEVEAEQRAEQTVRQELKQHEEAEAAAAAAAARKRQEEAAAKKQHEEEAAAKKQREEETSTAKPNPLKLTVIAAKVVGHKLVLSLRLSVAGVVSVFGRPIAKTSKSLEAGLRRLVVAIVRVAHGTRREHPASVVVSLRTTSGIVVSQRLTLRRLGSG